MSAGDKTETALRLVGWLRHYNLRDGTPVYGVSISTWLYVHGQRGLKQPADKAARCTYVERNGWLTGQTQSGFTVCYQAGGAP